MARVPCSGDRQREREERERRDESRERHECLAHSGFQHQKNESDSSEGGKE